MILTRLPIPRRLWQTMGLMDEESYATGILDKHLRQSGIHSLKGLTVLELGPGNGLLTAPYALKRGASKVWLVDSECLADPEIPEGAVYLTDGLESMHSIPSGSVDFLFSNAVLEHVRLR